MGFFDEKKYFHVKVTVTINYVQSKQDYEEKWILEGQGYASFVSIGVYDRGIFIRPYSSNSSIMNVKRKHNIYRMNLTTGTEITPTNMEDTQTTFTPNYFTTCNKAHVYGNDGDLLFSEVLPNIEEKFNEIGQIYYSNIGWSGGYALGSHLLTNTDFIKSKEKFGYKYEIEFINDIPEGDIQCPYYYEYNTSQFFGGKEIDFNKLQTTYSIDLTGCMNTPLEPVVEVIDRPSHYALMYLLSDLEKYKDITADKPQVEPVEIHYHVKLDGTKNPTVYLNWEVVAEELPEFFECHTIDIGVSYEENKAVVTLGTYEIMSEDTIKIAYGDLLKIADSAAFDVWWNNLKNGIGIGSIWLYFHSSYYKSDFFKCEIKQSFEVLDDLTYTAVSEPNGYPSLDLSEYVSGSDSDHDNEGDNSDKGDRGDGGSGSGVNPHSLLTTTYVMTPTRLKQLGSVLWGSGFMSNIKLVNNSPIENIVSVKMFPFTLPTSSDSEIVLGNVEMGVNGNILANNYSYEHEIGSVAISKHYNSFMDFAPYTRLMLYLPYVGVVELDNSLFMGRTLTIKYIIDIVLGTATVNLYANGIIIQKIGCQVGVDIPISSSNRASVEAGIVGNVLTSSIAGVASGGLLGGVVGGVGGALVSAGHAKYTTTTQGTPSSACSLYDYKNPILIIDRPSYQEVGGFAHSKGKMCLLNKTIKELSGFTIMDKNIEINNIRATKKEIDEIRNILSSGFYA